MTNTNNVEWLTGEVDDLLGAGRVGLYEFLEIQRGLDHPPAESDARRNAEHALEILLARGDLSLAWHIWGDVTYVRRANLSDVSDEAWRTPTEAPYLVLLPDVELSPADS